VAGTLSSQQRHVTTKDNESSTPMQRWISERPNESPYHIIGEVAYVCATSNGVACGQAGQHLETVSNQATAGSWGLGEEEGKEQV
jgi:hypothetical protein